MMTFMKRLGRWLKLRKDEITSACAILALVVGVGGFWLTLHQLSGARRALQAANGYQIQRDARQLIDEIAADRTFRAALNSGTLTPRAESVVLDKLWLMFNFYLSVYRQAEAGGISGEFVSSYEGDFCGFVKKPAVEQGWEKLLKRGSIGPDHVAMRKAWCRA